VRTLGVRRWTVPSGLLPIGKKTAEGAEAARNSPEGSRPDPSPAAEKHRKPARMHRSHPSLPNYLAVTGGDTFGITSDCTSCFVNAPNIVADRCNDMHDSCSPLNNQIRQGDLWLQGQLPDILNAPAFSAPEPGAQPRRTRNQ
jgi:hypothetical protein